jgi:hypothetical protein
MEDNKYKKYDDEVYDIDDIGGTDIKINPDYYIHHAILKAQGCLIKDDAQSGFLQFRIMVEHIQVLASSAGLLDEEFDKSLEEFKNKDSYKNEDNKTLKSVMLANEKLRLIMDGVFSSKPIYDSIKL